MNAVCILNTFSNAAGLGQTSSRHSSHPERRRRGSWVSTRGLCFLCLGVGSWENRGLFQFACGPEEACTVTNQQHVCKHRVEVLPPLGFAGERKPMLSAPPFPCVPTLTLSIHPPPSAPVTPSLGNQVPEKVWCPGFFSTQVKAQRAVVQLFLIKLSRMGKNSEFVIFSKDRHHLMKFLFRCCVCVCNGR